MTSWLSEPYLFWICLRDTCLLWLLFHLKAHLVSSLKDFLFHLRTGTIVEAFSAWNLWLHVRHLTLVSIVDRNLLGCQEIAANILHHWKLILNVNLWNLLINRLLALGKFELFAPVILFVDHCHLFVVRRHKILRRCIDHDQLLGLWHLSVHVRLDHLSLLNLQFIFTYPL